MLQGTQLETTLRGLAPGSSYEVSVMSMRGFEESEPLIGYVTTGTARMPGSWFPSTPPLQGVSTTTQETSAPPWSYGVPMLPTQMPGFLPLPCPGCKYRMFLDAWIPLSLADTALLCPPSPRRPLGPACYQHHRFVGHAQLAPPPGQGRQLCAELRAPPG